MLHNRSLYLAALRSTLRNTAAAYGYTLTVATSAMLLSALHGSPREGELFLFVAGGLGGFVALEGVLALWRPQLRDPTDVAFPVVGALNFIAVAAALGATSGVAHAVGSAELAWFLGPFAATAIYMSAVAAQIVLVNSRS